MQDTLKLRGDKIDNKPKQPVMKPTDLKKPIPKVETPIKSPPTPEVDIKHLD